MRPTASLLRLTGIVRDIVIVTFGLIRNKAFISIRLATWRHNIEDRLFQRTPVSFSLHVA
jgi:hypothetical protein